MSFHALPTAQLQAVVDFLFKEYKGQDKVHELIKFCTSAKEVSLIENVQEGIKEEKEAAPAVGSTSDSPNGPESSTPVEFTPEPDTVDTLSPPQV